jgi:hypothetical protein
MEDEKGDASSYSFTTLANTMRTKSNSEKKGALAERIKARFQPVKDLPEPAAEMAETIHTSESPQGNRN